VAVTAAGPAAADTKGGDGDGSSRASRLRVTSMAMLGVVTSVALFRIV